MKPDGRGFSYVNLLNGVKTNDHGWGWNFDSRQGGKLHVTCCNLNGPEGLAYIPYIAVMQDAQRNPVINFVVRHPDICRLNQDAPLRSHQRMERR
jgi:hypothetical protein